MYPISCGRGLRTVTRPTGRINAQWAAFDRVLMLLNSIHPHDNETADQMRRRIYGLIMEMRPE